MKLSKKSIIIGVAAVLLVGGGTGGFILHNNQVQAQQLKEKEEKKAAYDQLKKDVEAAIDKAYETRKEEDLKTAEEAIGKLKEKDQEKPKERFAKLQSFLVRIKATDTAVTKAEKSKSDEDIKSAQALIDTETDDYLKEDKKGHQARLDKVKKAVSDEKAKKDKEAAANEANTATNNNYVEETPAPATEVPTYQTPPQQAASPAQPAQPATPAPSTPAGNSGGSTGAATTDELNQSAQDAANSDWSGFYK